MWLPLKTKIEKNFLLYFSSSFVIVQMFQLVPDLLWCIFIYVSSACFYLLTFQVCLKTLGPIVREAFPAFPLYQWFERGRGQNCLTLLTSKLLLYLKSYLSDITAIKTKQRWQPKFSCLVRWVVGDVSKNIKVQYINCYNVHFRNIQNLSNYFYRQWINRFSDF